MNTTSSNSLFIGQAAVQNPSTATAVPLPLTREVGVKDENLEKIPCPPCQRGPKRRRASDAMRRRGRPMSHRAPQRDNGELQEIKTW